MKLTPADVRRLRQQRADGAPSARLALEYGVSVATVHDVCAGRSWRRTGGTRTRGRKTNN
jgi:hypothetical protein